MFLALERIKAYSPESTAAQLGFFHSLVVPFFQQIIMVLMGHSLYTTLQEQSLGSTLVAVESSGSSHLIRSHGSSKLSVTFMAAQLLAAKDVSNPSQNSFHLVLIFLSRSFGKDHQLIILSGREAAENPYGKMRQLWKGEGGAVVQVNWKSNFLLKPWKNWKIGHEIVMT